MAIEVKQNICIHALVLFDAVCSGFGTYGVQEHFYDVHCLNEGASVHDRNLCSLVHLLENL